MQRWYCENEACGVCINDERYQCLGCDGWYCLACSEVFDLSGSRVCTSCLTVWKRLCRRRGVNHLIGLDAHLGLHRLL